MRCKRLRAYLPVCVSPSSRAMYDIWGAAGFDPVTSTTVPSNERPFYTWCSLESRRGLALGDYNVYCHDSAAEPALPGTLVVAGNVAIEGFQARQRFSECLCFLLLEPAVALDSLGLQYNPTVEEHVCAMQYIAYCSLMLPSLSTGSCGGGRDG